jgi:Zn finger protein HypA/HybF involved in hydrogenase expression
MVIAPTCCGAMIRIWEHPYKFRCWKCGKEKAAEMVIEGRNPDEELEIYHRWKQNNNQWDA